MEKYTVTELTKKIKGLIKNEFPGLIAVTGEISNLSGSSSGHRYFNLKDENSGLKAVLFKRYAAINSGYTPKNGDAVKAIGEMALYEPDGSYQIVVHKIEYDSVGLFWQLFEEVKRKLEAEGLFDESIKKNVPVLPKRVALLTSMNGAAVNDFLTTRSRYPHFYDVDIWNIPVQGKDALPIIVKTLKKVGELVNRYDIIVLTRGGGSLDDLAVFNEEAIARALAESKVPSVSAIGHERDFTICDFVADLRVATPTAAAAKIAEGFTSYSEKVDKLADRLTRGFETQYLRKYQKLDILLTRLNGRSPISLIQNLNSRLIIAENRLKSSSSGIISSKFRVLENLQSRLDRQNPNVEIVKFKNRTEVLIQKIKDLAYKKIETKKTRLDNLLIRLNALSPEDIMSRGYAIVLMSGAPVTSVKTVHLQDELEIKLKDGYINSFVTGRKVSEDKDGKNSDNRTGL